MCNSIDVYLPVPSLSLSLTRGNSFCGLNIPQKFHSRSGRHFKTVYTVRGVRERMKEESAETKETRSLCRLVRSLVSKMSQPKRIAIIYGFLMRRQSASQPTNLYTALFSLSLSIHTYHIVYIRMWREKFGLRFHYSWI